MTKIAIDIALLLPEKINKICTDINRKNDSNAFSNLSKKNNHPHITLAMGVIDEKNLPKIDKKLKEISKEFSSLNLEIIELYFEITPENKKSVSFVVKPSDKLKALHAKIMKELLPLFSYKVSDNMFFLDSDEKFQKVSMFWIENYRKNHSDPNNYHPHISLKCRKAQYDKLPIKFSASKLAACHLGNYCTCRKILASVNLK